MFDEVMQNEGYLNMSNAINKTKPITSTNNTPVRLALDAGETMNTTLSLNHTTGLNNGTLIDPYSPEMFYRWRLPMEVIISLVTYALQYWWLILLERMLPARSRPEYKERPPQLEEKVENSEDREEEFVQK
ncbi:uncharacterized protein K460DRAFT_354945 [Cucurbitaria berberidis CBS 394.84]|uniref:Uncharacterized protein n=1 Tax=Cucurbitaria berberidis CBS 394.84 TaxID=1168544 RepID=A0A9P4L8B7_9PLEO|nr:uncharacterized protein K460DRAFT_354945 [Cucurbitaria berberidis CBS 394.84]KAF1845093.1 hypothetical protein K460DRAFT_354945 [Cucurbitaria berberidis CBS 394.84]